ncbi:MAG: cation diffusion facilitator family transporter [Elusimicrobia bacterium]|nr:cation diffusion facilitator family transporter [Candidatus Obscuribacterium magneticum]
MKRAALTRFAWLSIAASLVTLTLKFASYWITGSVGLLSDAVESIVNLMAGVFALAMLIIAARPPDEKHPYGHSKAEYFAGGMEGTLILFAAAGIAITAVKRLMVPQALEKIGVGLMICAAASLVNLAVALVLLRAGKKYTSLTLEADAHHLLTDVWTSVGVIGGVGAVGLTGWHPLDPIVALVVAVNIVWTGSRLVHRSVLGLMDTAWPKNEQEQVLELLEAYKRQGVRFHALRTHQAGARRFVSVHVLVPGGWSVQRGHQLSEELEALIRERFRDVTVFTHLEPVEDPVSWEDQGLDR